MKFLRNLASGMFPLAGILAALACLAFLLSDTEAGRMASAYAYLVNKTSAISDRIIGLNSAVANASDTPLNAPREVPPLEVPQQAVASPAPAPVQSSTPLAMPNPMQSPDAALIAATDDVNKIPLEFADQSISSSDILDDKLNLVPQDFKIPPALKKRVGFWLDVYTRYTSHFALIHDANFPWVVYRVVDLRSIYAQPVNRFVKDANDRRAVVHAKFDVRQLLLRLSLKRNYQALSTEEYKMYKLLEEIPGPRKTVFRQAANRVREQRGQKDYYRHGLITSSRYLNEMEEIFARYDLPIELVRLPLVESSFNIDAQSKVGASGIWQFMRSTGKRYLRVGNVVDERNSPLKATEAAAKLMLSNFRVLHSWPLAITAYNHGAGGVAKACKALKTQSVAEIVSNYRSRSFSFASKNFYSEFLAALYGEKYQDKVFGPMVKYPPLAAESVDIKYSIKAKTLCGITGITIEELRLYNPDLRTQAIAGSTFLPVGYHMRLPYGHKARLELFFQEADQARAKVKKLYGRKTSGFQRQG